MTRLLYIQALETSRCMEEGVLTNAADGDLGSVLGWSFPTYTGGTLSLIDTVGLPTWQAVSSSPKPSGVKGCLAALSAGH